MKTVTLILYTNTEFLNDEFAGASLNAFPQFLQDKINAYQGTERKNRIASKLLLSKAFTYFFQERIDVLNHYAINTNNKPFLKDWPLHFSNSHSGNICCVAASLSGQPGIDVELIQPVDIKLLKDFFHANEWNIICRQGIGNFYDFWTRKEAVLKADGNGVQKELFEIDASTSPVLYNNVRYFVQPVFIAENYCTHVAHTIKDFELRMEEIKF